MGRAERCRWCCSWLSRRVRGPAAPPDATVQTATGAVTPDIGNRVIGAHVVQPLREINGKWVIYGLWNNIAAQQTPVEGTHRGLR